jgi:hypothetical protein
LLQYISGTNWKIYAGSLSTFRIIGELLIIGNHMEGNKIAQ